MLSGCSFSSTSIPAGRGHIFPLARTWSLTCLFLGNFEPAQPQGQMRGHWVRRRKLLVSRPFFRARPDL